VRQFIAKDDDNVYYYEIELKTIIATRETSAKIR
jgi:hypothetical protein